MDRDEILGQLANLKIYLQRINKEQVIREKELGNQSLKDFSQMYDDLIRDYNLILDNSDRISTSILSDIKGYYKDLASFFRRVEKLSHEVFISEKEKIIDEFKYFYDEFLDVWSRVVALIKANDNHQTLTSLLEYHRLSQKSLEEEKNILKEEVTEAKEILNSLKEQVKEYETRYESINTNVELETQVDIFKAQAEKNLKDANKWLFGIVGSTVLLVIILLWVYFDFKILCLNISDYLEYNGVCNNCGQQVLWVDMIRGIFFRLLILSAIIYALSFCVKNYNACMHNKTNNNHRHNSFAAALHFYNTTTGEKREEILIKVADAIFTYQKSGYYGKNNEPANPSIIQSVIEKVSGKTE